MIITEFINIILLYYRPYATSYNDNITIIRSLYDNIKTKIVVIM